MFTIFTTPKPFAGHIDIIQRNALESWRRLHPDVEVILFGNEKGAAEVGRELGLHHEPHLERNRLGTPRADFLFERAQAIARHNLLCYSNCDILLLDDFREALPRVARQFGAFLMAGRRWDVDIGAPLEFSRSDWPTCVRDLAFRMDRQRPPQWIDYFAFRKGLFQNRIPALVIGRAGWDNWLLWFARSSGAAMIDASAVVCAVHQNHDYSHHPGGEKGVAEGEEAQENYKFLEGHRKYATLDNATHLLQADGFHRNYRHWLVQSRRRAADGLSPVWFRFLDLTRPIRHRLNMRRRTTPAARP